MNVVLNLGMGCVRGAIDRDWAHPYLISAPFLLTHSFPDPPVCHDTLAWVLGTGGLHAGKYTVDISIIIPIK